MGTLHMKRRGWLGVVFCIFFLFVSSTPTGPGFSRLGVIGITSEPLCYDNQNTTITVAGGCWLSREINSRVLCQVSHNVPSPTQSVIVSEEQELFVFSQLDAQFYTGEFDLDFDDDDSDERQMFSGSWTIVIKSSSCSDIVMPLTNNESVFAVLYNEFNNPAGFAVSQLFLDNLRFDNQISHAAPEPVEAILIREIGPEVDLIYEFTDPTNPIIESINFIGTRETELYHQQHAYQVTNSNRSTLAGGLRVLDPTPEINYAFRLSGFNTSEVGAAVMSVQCNGFLEYMIVHTMSNIISAELRLGSASLGLDGTFIRSLDGSVRSPIIGSFTIPDDILQLLIEENVYILLQDDVGRSIQGQIAPEVPYYSYFSGSQVVPRQSTFYRGIGFYSIENSVDILDYEIYDTIPSAMTISVFNGDFGENGELITFDSVLDSNPTYGAVSIESSDQLGDIFNQQWYFALDSNSGSLRGQLLRRVESQCLIYDDEDVTLSWSDDDHYTSNFNFEITEEESSVATTLSTVTLLLVGLLSIHLLFL